MKMLTICLGVLAAFVAASAARATTFAKMSLEQMSQQARQIVRARCVSNTVAWDAGEIWTFTTLDIEESWRGDARGRITIRLLGGRTAQFTSQVSGIPRFHPGEEVILFLEPTPRGGFSVVSWQQGTFRLRKDAGSAGEIVTQDTALVAAFDPATHRFLYEGIRNLPLVTLRARVANAIAHSSGGTQ